MPRYEAAPAASINSDTKSVKEEDAIERIEPRRLELPVHTVRDVDSKVIESAIRIILKCLAEIGKTTCTYSFSGQLVAAAILTKQISNSSAQTASITETFPYINTWNLLTLAPLFQISNSVSTKFGELQGLEREVVLMKERVRQIKGDMDPQENMNPQERVKALNEINETSSSRKAMEERINEIKKEIIAINQAGILIATVLSIFFILALVFSEPILIYVLRQNANAAQFAQSYMEIYAFAVWFGLAIRLVIEQILLSFEYRTLTMVTGLIELVVSTVLAWQFGLNIAAIAGIYAGAANFTGLVYCVFLESLYKFQSYGFFRFWRGDYQLVKSKMTEILKKGGVFALNAVADVVMSFVAGILIGLGSVGLEQQSAYSIALIPMLLGIMGILAAAQVCAQKVRYNLGDRNYLNASRVARWGLLAAFVFNAPLLVAIAAYPKAITRALGLSNTYQEPMINTITRILAIGGLGDIFRTVITQVLRALNDQWIPLILTYSIFAVSLLVSGILKFKLNPENQVYGVVASTAGASILAAILLISRWWVKTTPVQIEECFEIREETTLHVENFYDSSNAGGTQSVDGTRGGQGVPELRATSLQVSGNPGSGINAEVGLELVPTFGASPFQNVVVATGTFFRHVFLPVGSSTDIPLLAEKATTGYVRVPTKPAAKGFWQTPFRAPGIRQTLSVDSLNDIKVLEQRKAVERVRSTSGSQYKDATDNYRGMGFNPV